MEPRRDWMRSANGLRSGIVAAILAAVVASGAAQAGHATGDATPGRSQVPESSDAVVSPNWSGYVVTGRPGTRYSSVTGTWRVPAVSCGHEPNAFSTIAVGLGGFGGNAQSDEQVGTDANCRASGKPTYFGWFDVAPYPSYNVPQRVSPGDLLTATVSIISTERPPLVKVQLEDRTAGWSFSREISWVSAGRFLVAPGEQNAGGASSPGASSAEWLVEAPSSCHHQLCTQTSLANFGSVAMTGISAVANGSTGTLTDPAWKATRLRLVPGRVRVPTYPSSTPFARNPAVHGTAASPAGATPARASGGGRQFRVKWVAVAGKNLL